MLQLSAPVTGLRFDDDSSSARRERRKRQAKACDAVAARATDVDLRLERCPYHFDRDHGFRLRVCAVCDLHSQPYVFSGNELTGSDDFQIELSLLRISLQVIRNHLIEVKPCDIAALIGTACGRRFKIGGLLGLGQFF